jgi:hypothetical protein
MKSEVTFYQRFEAYELHDYAEARYWANRAILERDEVIEELYDDCGPTITGVDYEVGRMFATSTPVEDMAILIIDKKESYNKMIQRYTTKAEMFELAMESLTPREQDVIRVVYQGATNDLGLNQGYFHQVLREAEEKLCSYIGQKRLDKLKDQQISLVEQRKQRVAEYQRHKVKVS